jgi:hypothetical protein
MKSLSTMFSKLLPKTWDLPRSRSAIRRGYESQLVTARRAHDRKAVSELEDAKRWELQLIDELEDEHLTSDLKQARRLRVPVAHLRNVDDSCSEHWYQGSQTGGWYLNALGAQSLRREIREERKQRHEARALLLPWITAITGAIGTLTGLVAVLANS